jgi:hypothetical protein
MLGIGMAYGMFNPTKVWSSDRAIFFDGVNDKCTITFENADITNTIPITGTISLWIKMEDTGSDMTILHLKHGARQYMEIWWDASETTICFTRTDTNGSNPVTAVSEAIDGEHAGVLIHIHCFWNVGAGSSGLVLSINGVPLEAQEALNWLGTTDVDITYGERNNAQPFNGYIHNVLFSSGTSSAVDVYNSGYPKNESYTSSSSIILYHTASEKDFADETHQHPTLTNPDGLTVAFDGAIIKALPSG